MCLAQTTPNIHQFYQQHTVCTKAINKDSLINHRVGKPLDHQRLVLQVMFQKHN